MEFKTSGSSKLYSRKCFGYKHNENGDLIIDEGQAEVVRMIFDSYLSGLSIVLIIRKLQKRNIKSSQGEETWSKHAIQRILTNEKFMAMCYWERLVPMIFQIIGSKKRWQSRPVLNENAHEPIIEEEKFIRVQEEMKRWSNIEIVLGQTKRKGTHYSLKRD